MFKLFRESPSDCRDEEDDVLLEDSDDGRAGFPVFPVSAFRRHFQLSISQFHSACGSWPPESDPDDVQS